MALALALGLILGLVVGELLGRRRRRPIVLDELTRDELYERARAEDIAGRSGMTKDELRDALRATGT